MLVRAKAWTAVVLVSLALGIGANTAIFSAVNGLLLDEIPVRDPATLVRLRWSGENDMVSASSDYGYAKPGSAGEQVRTTFSYAMYRQFVADNRTMDDLLACAPYGRVGVVVDGQADVANAFISTGNYYNLLGARARLGRTVQPDDDRAGAEPVAVISSKYWHSRFVTDPAVIGKTIRVNNVAVTIVGVLDPGFTGIQQVIAEPPDIGLPLAIEPQFNAIGEPRIGQPTYWWLQVVGRLKPGATAAQAHGNLSGVFRATARAGMDSYLRSLPEAERSTAVNRSRAQVPSLLVESARRGVYDVHANQLGTAALLGAVVVLVLLIVCANVANLMLSRTTARQRELSVRLSLGATRGRLIRQLLAESLLLASIGGALGILVGYWGKGLLPPPFHNAALADWRVVAFVAVLTPLTSVLFGIAPALRATGTGVSDALKQTGRSVAGPRTLLGKALLVVQVAISIVLLVGAGLFLRTLQNLRHVDVGFNPHNILLFRVQPHLNRYDEARSRVLTGDILERVAAVPGVRSAAFTNPALLSGSTNSTSVYVRGRVYSPSRDDRSNHINRLVVSNNFFDVLEIPLLAGRAFTAADGERAPKVVIVNEAAARTYFPNDNPIGQRFGTSIERSGEMEIVGVVRDAKYNSVRDPAPPTMYVPYMQTRAFGGVIAVRSAVEPSSLAAPLREAVRQIDANLPITDVSTQLEQIERRFAQERVFALAYTLFGGLALLLAAIGLFGLMSYSVARRTNEIGVRMALGAQRRDVLRLVMRESMVLVALGVCAGAAVAFGITRFVESLLFGLSAVDLPTIAAAIAVMVGVSAFAAFLPARRASRVDPMVALRYDA